MKKLHYTTKIQAPAEKVYTTMLGIDSIKTYELWTAEFNPTSTYEGNWQAGSKMLFVGTDKEGKRAGMISRIVAHTPSKFVSIQHYGMLDGDKEITEGPEVEEWTGSHENYSFTEQDGVTTVTVEMDSNDEYEDYCNSAWPKALNKLREIVESAE